MVSLLQILLGCQSARLRSCTLAETRPRWTQKWITRASPSWNVSERRTQIMPGIRFSFCPWCLTEDLEFKRCQFIRLEWYCAFATFCARHHTPLATCCERFSPGSVHHGRDRFDHQRLYCSDCGQALAARQPANDQTEPGAIFALTHFENLLRMAIAGESVLVNGRYSVPGESLLRFVEDMAWALMPPLEGSPHRLLHIVQRSAFRVPFGFNTPADVPDWLFYGSLLLRRSILAVLASLLLGYECSFRL